MAGEESSQILQQIESLLAQLAQSQPEPQVQQAIKGIQQQVEPLQQILGAQQAQNMQGGLTNPGAPGEQPPGAAPGGGPPEGETGGPSQPPGGHGSPVLAIHIGAPPPGGPKTFGDAKKAAMAQHSESGHFDRNTPKGETPSTPRTKAKAKG